MSGRAKVQQRDLKSPHTFGMTCGQAFELETTIFCSSLVDECGHGDKVDIILEHHSRGDWMPFSFLFFLLTDSSLKGSEEVH